METTVFTLADMHARLAELRVPHTNADTVQMALAKALLARCAEKSDHAQQCILAKVATVLERYENTIVLAPIPLDPMQQPATVKSGLSGLLELLNRDSRHANTESATAALDELMERMERDIVRPAAPRPSLTTKAIPAKKSRSRKKTAAIVPAGQELKAVRQARKSMALDKACRLVDDMNTRQPENPGPLNPQMLATKAITQMRDLSPAYLNRFLTMMDTLLWLPKN